MPNLNGMKFPYTPAGKARYQKIKKAIGSKSASKPTRNPRKPISIGSKRPQVPGMYYPGSKKKLR
jgi:hypothetical protein